MHKNRAYLSGNSLVAGWDDRYMFPMQETGTYMTNELIVELSKVKAIFQQRAILSAMGVTQRDLVEAEVEQCDICGDHHEENEIPKQCETGDGV